MSKTSQVTRVEWNKLNWRKLERAVFKLQNRILRAAQRGDTKAVRKLQKTLTRSWSAKCLAIRERIQGEKGEEIDNSYGVKKGNRFLTSAEQIQTFTQSLSLLFKANKTAKLEDLILKINTTIQDLKTPNQYSSSAKIRKRIHHNLHQMVMHWGRRRTGSYHRAYHLYWPQLNGRIQWLK